MRLEKELNDKVVKCFQVGISHMNRACLTPEEYDEIERRGIEIHVSAVYMDGTADYSFYDRSNK